MNAANENVPETPLPTPHPAAATAAEPSAERTPQAQERASRDEAEDDDRPRGFTVTDRRFWNLDEEALAREENRPSAPTVVDRLQTQLAEKDRQLREYIAAYKQEVVQNLEKTKERLERDAAAKIGQLRGQLAVPMLDVLDAIERALAAAQSATSVAAVAEGFGMVHLLMLQKFGEFGLTRIATVGTPFDPRLHEAVSVAAVSDPAQHNLVLAELRPGFTLDDRLVRPALVQVGRQA